MIKKFVILVFCLIMVIAAGCTAKKQAGSNISLEPEASKIMNDFIALVQRDSGVEEAADFISNKISLVSKKDAAKMVDEFEKIQKKSLPQFEDMFAKDDIQNKINNEYKAITAQSDIKDAGLKELLAKTKNSGYKVETAEGSFFPIIDYGFYKGFSSYVTADMKDYIDIMAVESGKVPAKDAALVIGWDEVVKRSLNQEKFMSAHKDSVKFNDVKDLYKKYVTFTLYGANNTPLFSYDSNTLKPEAREIYFNAVGNPGDSEYLKALGGFMDLVKNNNYKLTDEVVKYRNNFVKNI